MRNFFYVLILVKSVFCCIQASAQNYSLYNSYAVNPYLYNPAEVATEYTYVFVNHRQQWMGVEGAPILTTVNINTLLNETHAGIGAKVSSFKRGLLNTTDLNFTYAYGVHFNRQTTMFFGLSAGAITSNIDVEQANPSDPALTNYLANNFQPTANFGMLLRSASGLNFGIVLPQLFNPNFNGLSNFDNLSFSPTDNIIVTTYYKRRIEGKIVSRNKKGVRAKTKTKVSTAPLEFYAMYKYAKSGNGQFEVMGKLNLSENFWLGTSYRQSNGFAGLLGFSFNKFLLSYSYEPGNQPEPVFSQGTHEIQLGLRLGEMKKLRQVIPILKSTLKITAPQHSARFEHTNEDPDNTKSDQQVKKKYYVVIKSFADFASADAYKKKLISDKYNANVFYYPKEKKYHVHVLETSKQSDAHEEIRNLKTYTKLKGARLLVVPIEE